jgi:hypothetical protein
VNVVALRILIIVWILFTWLAPPMLAQLAPSTATKRCLALCALALSVVGLYLLAGASGGRARTADVIAGAALVFVSAAHTFRSNLFERR